MSERTTSSIHVRRPAWLDEFRAFIMRGNVVDLAVGIIIGVAFTAVVNSLVKDIFTPLMGMLVGGDVVEVAPQYDPTSNTAMVGAQMLFELFSLMVLGRRFRQSQG